MQVEQIEEGVYILHGRIRDISDYHELKELLEKHRQLGKPKILFKIPQAREINSLILGYLLKLARKDGFRFHLLIANPYLYEHLHRLGLHVFFELENGS